MLLLVAAAPVLGVVAEVAGEVEPPPGDAVGVEHVRGLGRVRHPAGATINTIMSSCMVTTATLPGVWSSKHTYGTDCNSEKGPHLTCTDVTSTSEWRSYLFIRVSHVQLDIM